MRRSDAIDKLVEFVDNNYQCGHREYEIKPGEWAFILDFIEKEIGMYPPEYRKDYGFKYDEETIRKMKEQDPDIVIVPRYMYTKAWEPEKDSSKDG